ncbi:MAG: DUF4349 domain-containing protein [Ornithinibacter sp.]
MRVPFRPTSRLTSGAAALVIGVGLVALSGCSAGAGSDSGAADSAVAGAGSSDSSGAGADSSVKQEGARVVGAPNGAPGSAAKPADAASSITAVSYDRKLARRADISITVADVDAAAVKVRAIAASAQGLVTAEAISSEPDVAAGGGFSTITISVPTADLDATLDQLAKLGKVHSRNASTDDVTAQYVDTEARVKTMQASVDRVRALMSQATKLGDVVALEAELSRRQADLEATQSQLAALKDSVALSPVEVRLSTDEQVLQQADDSTGFLAGLEAGWGAFTSSVTVLLTALGAVLPFAVIAALVLVPLAVWLRRRSARTSVAAPPVVSAPPAA